MSQNTNLNGDQDIKNRKKVWGVMKTKLLDQSTTSQDEENQQKKLDESHKKEGIFKWLVDLYKIKEDDVNMYAGTEAVVYLAFVR